jgi:mitochondrial fission protein ELM1
VLVGGADKDTRFDADVAARLGRSVSEIANRSGGSLLVTTSRRTPQQGLALVSCLTAPAFVHVWTPEGRNPFFGFLGLADYIVVTGDSVSMCTEACATGKPVFIFSPYGAKGSKHTRFHEELFAASLARPLGGEMIEWRHGPINPAHDVARVIRQLRSNKLRARRGSRNRDVGRIGAKFVNQS